MAKRRKTPSKVAVSPEEVVRDHFDERDLSQVVFQVDVQLSFDGNDLVDAIEYGRRNDLTYERDEEWGGLLEAAYRAGFIEESEFAVDYYVIRRTARRGGR